MDMESIPLGVRKGSWTEEEDTLLRKCIEQYGEGKWHLVPVRAGLNRCRKSCRLRWLNYLRPNIKRGDFALDEVDLMFKLHKLLGNRWSLIAGRLPGRTANDVKNYWNTKVGKKIVTRNDKSRESPPEISVCKIIKPKPLNLSKKSSSWLSQNVARTNQILDKPSSSSVPTPPPSNDDDFMQWWETLYANANEIGHVSSLFSLSALEERLWSEENTRDEKVLQDVSDMEICGLLVD